MTGFANVKAGIAHFFEHIAGDVDADVKAALALLQPSITAVTAAIKAHGPALIQGVGAAMVAAATASVTAASGGTDLAVIASAAGAAALAAGKSAAETAGITLTQDALHALSTTAVASTGATA